MKKPLLIITLLVASFALAGCGNQNKICNGVKYRYDCKENVIDLCTSIKIWIDPNMNIDGFNKCVKENQSLFTKEEPKCYFDDHTGYGWTNIPCPGYPLPTN